MKRFILLFLIMIMTGVATFAETVEIEDVSNVNMQNFWDKKGKSEQKILEIGQKILYANKIDKRVAFQMNRSLSTINAVSYSSNKTVVIYYGILPYIDNDDELAFILGHEISHALDAYGGPLTWAKVRLNGKAYETKADLIGADLMVKAGYNPIYAITELNKWTGEDYWDIWIFTTHPKTSVRLMNLYKYIYVKYPWALKTDAINNISYQNFMNSSAKEIKEFLQHEQERKNLQPKEDL